MSKRASKNQSAWSAGVPLDIPKAKPCVYELRLQELGLQDSTTEELVNSQELKEFCTSIRQERFVPEILLHRWGLTTIWGGGRSDRHKPRLSYEDIQQISKKA